MLKNVIAEFPVLFEELAHIANKNIVNFLFCSTVRCNAIFIVQFNNLINPSLLVRIARLAIIRIDLVKQLGSVSALNDTIIGILIYFCYLAVNTTH